MVALSQQFQSRQLALNIAFSLLIAHSPLPVTHYTCLVRLSTSISFGMIKFNMYQGYDARGFQKMFPYCPMRWKFEFC